MTAPDSSAPSVPAPVAPVPHASRVRVGAPEPATAMSAREPRALRLPLLLSVGAAALILWLFHARFWYAPDEGAYAHVADRLLHGEVLHRDVQDVHMGYVNFANAASLHAFGNRLVSLRYPLIAIGVLSAAFAGALLAPRGPLVAVAAALAVAALSIVQFLNPTAHWYCFGLFWAIVAAVTWLPPGTRGRLPLIGFLVGLVFLFRQLTGVLVAVGVLAWLLAEPPIRRTDFQSVPSDAPTSPRLARLLCALLWIGLALYLSAKTEPLAFVLYGAWPLTLLAIVASRTKLPDRAVVSLLARLTAGALAAAVPLIAYHVHHGSVSIWLADTVFSAESLTRLDFFRRTSFPLLIVASVGQLLSAPSLTAAINALFWIAALLAAPAVGVVALSQLLRSDDDDCPAWTPLVVLATFYAVVSLHFQIPIYLFYSLSVTLASLLWLASADRSRRSFAVAGCAALSLVGIFCHAGQPLTRNLIGVLRGERVDLVPAGIDRAGLSVADDDRAAYSELLRLIDRETDPGEPILALPVNPELYYLSGRRNPVRFFNAALGLSDKAALHDVLARLAGDPPQLVFFRPDDKYVTPPSLAIIDHVRRRYERLPDVGKFEVYRRSDAHLVTSTE